MQALFHSSKNIHFLDQDQSKITHEREKNLYYDVFRD